MTRRDPFDASWSVLACLCIMIPNVRFAFQNKGERRRKGKWWEKSAASRRPPLLLPLLSHFSKCLSCGVDHLLHLLTTSIFPGVERLCIIRWRFLGLVFGLGVIFWNCAQQKAMRDPKKLPVVFTSTRNNSCSSFLVPQKSLVNILIVTTPPFLFYLFYFILFYIAWKSKSIKLNSHT